MDFFHVHVSPRSRTLAGEVLAWGWLSEGKMTRRFEQDLAARLGILHAVAVNSGTAALHLGLALAGGGAGGEVILAPQTFVGTGLSVPMHGGLSVFAAADPLA